MARDNSHSKHRKDKRRHGRKQQGGHKGRGGQVAGQRRTGTEVRVEGRRGDATKAVREERYDMPIPRSVKPQVRKIFVKRNTAVESDSRERGSLECLRSHVLVLVMKGNANVIEGLPVPNASSRKLRKVGFTHTAVQAIPEGARAKVSGRQNRRHSYDERGWQLTFYKPKSGSRRRGHKGGEVVHRLNDELLVIQWLYENGLSGLWDNQHLVSAGLLPMRDEERMAENAMRAQANAIFGRNMRAIPERHFHSVRLLGRLMELHSGDQDAAMSAFAQTRLGRQELGRVFTSTFDSQRYYVAKDGSVAYAIHDLSGCQYMVRVNLASREVTMEPLQVDAMGRVQWDNYQSVTDNPAFTQVDEGLFASLKGGRGILTTGRRAS